MLIKYISIFIIVNTIVHTIAIAPLPFSISQYNIVVTPIHYIASSRTSVIMCLKTGGRLMRLDFTQDTMPSHPVKGAVVEDGRVE